MTERRPNRNDVAAFVAGLSPELEAVYRTAEAIERDVADTLSSEYQIAAGITAVFWEEAKKGTPA